MTQRRPWVAPSLDATTWEIIRPAVITLAAGIITLASCTMGNTAPVVTCDMRTCSDWGGTRSQKPAARAHAAGFFDANGNSVVIGHRPPGCPRAHCGCSTSLYLFGKIIPELNLAANWMRKFPVSASAPGMVAARRGHVMVLLSHVEGSDWLVYDPNSGGGLTRQHVRSIRGYRIVNPHGAYAEK